MKLRRSLAAAVATAAIIPAALMAAPAAQAQDTVTGETTTGETTTGETTTGETTTGETATGETATGETTTGETTTGETTTGETTTGETTTGETTTGETTTGETTTGETTTGETTTGETTTGETTTGETTTGETTTGETTTGETTTGGPGGEEPPLPEVPDCEAAAFNASLSGFPNKVVAGSGWKEFNLNLDNSAGKKTKDVVLGMTVLYKSELAGGGDDLAAKYADLQYFDGEKWSSDLSEGGNIAGLIDVEAGEKISLQLRLKVSAKAKPGAGVAIAFGVYEKKNGTCALDEKTYEFEILAAGSDAGNPGDAKPQGGRNVLPTGNVGELAQTGSDTPVAALAGSAAGALLLGAAAVYVVRRRNGSTEVESAA
ncbi:LPXTG cell wall anchor domain-containing protein [Streptomyces polyrhachis]|uniref:LPXTG cell wall anchor domain-containing protein n=1 Tax=Streptomyces polyrhachis TaxID=1282885 RepID=A0ABW2GNJ5_9ACTN